MKRLTKAQRQALINLRVAARQKYGAHEAAIESIIDAQAAEIRDLKARLKGMGPALAEWEKP